MRITQEDDYALRVVLFLYRYGRGKRIEAKQIAEQENIPLRFLLKLLRKLAAEKIVSSYRGSGGGYSIELPPSQVTVRRVVEAIEGPICVNKCLGDPKNCNLNRTATCPIHRALGQIQASLLERLDDASFETLLADEKLAEESGGQPRPVK